MTKGKSALKATANASGLSPWDGKKHTYPEFRKALIKWATLNSVVWILNAGRALFNRMQELQEDFKKKKKNFKPTFEAHDAKVWAEALQSRDNGCVEAQLSVVKVDTLKQRFGSNFTEYAKCGFTDETKHASAIDNALEQKLLEMNILVISALSEAIIEKSDKSLQKEALKRILVTAEIRNLVDGGAPKDIEDWFDNPQIMPAVSAWFQILWKYEGMAENVDSNFVTDFNEIADSGVGADSANITDVNSRLELLLEPAVKAFTTVQDLCDHMRICALVKIIKVSAKGNSKQAVAWKLADDALVAATRTNTLLTMTNVNNAISLAQRHLDRDDEDEEVQTLTTSATTQELETLKAQLAEAQASIKTLKAEVAKPDNKDKAGGGVPRGKRQKTGDRTEFQTCTICGKKHPGKPPESKCFKRDLEGEKRELEELIKKKASSGYGQKQEDKDATDRKWKARVAFIEDADNKATEHYLLSLSAWSPTLALPATDYTVTTLNVTQGACVDSGSPVNITMVEDEVNLTAWPQVHLNGVLPGSVP